MPDMTKVEGAIQIAPPLNWTEIQQVEYILKKSRYGPAFAMDLKVVENETEEGTFTRKTCEWLKPRDHQFVAYDLEDRLRAVVKALPDHEFQGSFVCYDEELGSVPWRLVVKMHAVEKQFAQISWPD